MCIYNLTLTLSSGSRSTIGSPVKTRTVAGCWCTGHFRLVTFGPLSTVVMMLRNITCWYDVIS